MILPGVTPKGLQLSTIIPRIQEKKVLHNILRCVPAHQLPAETGDLKMLPGLLLCPSISTPVPPP